MWKKLAIFLLVTNAITLALLLPVNEGPGDAERDEGAPKEPGPVTPIVEPVTVMPVIEPVPAALVARSVTPSARVRSVQRDIEVDAEVERRLRSAERENRLSREPEEDGPAWLRDLPREASQPLPEHWVDAPPKAEDAYWELVELLQAQGRLAEAERLLLAIQDAHPRMETPYQALARIYEIMDRRKERLGQLEGLLLLRPDAWEVRIELAEHYLEYGAFDRAIEYLDTLRGQSDNGPYDGRVHFHRLMGHALVALGQREEAIGHLQIWGEMDPEEPDVHWTLSEQYWQMGLFEEALTEANLLIEMRPLSADALMHRSNFLEESGFPAEAIADREAAVELAPERFEYRAALAEALAQAGQFDAAVSELDMAIGLLPPGSRRIGDLEELRVDILAESSGGEAP